MVKKIIKKEAIKKPTSSKMELVGTVAKNATIQNKNKSNVQKVHIPLKSQKPVIFQAKNGAIELRGDITKETLWATQAQISELFNVERSVITKHLKNVYKDAELEVVATCAKFAQVQNEGGREVVRNIEYYNLDMIISVGYRVNSKVATEFRKWATKTLKDHLTKGYTINKKVIAKNYKEFLNSVNEIKALLPEGNFSDIKNVLELVNAFAGTWLTLDSYDKENYTKDKVTKKKISLTADELTSALLELKKDLIKKDEATEIFAVDRNKESLEGIIGNVMQSFGGSDVYDSIEEKAVHLLYFIIKNHPFIDGNKRSGAFAFIWFLNKYKLLNKEKISPEALSAIALLIAESNPEHKDKIIKLVMSLISKK